MKKVIFVFVVVFFFQEVFSQEVSKYSVESALELMEIIDPMPFAHTSHPDAQWFPDAGLGLFLHWGIHSVAALNPSWSMIKNCWWVKRDCPVSPQDYYRLAEEFDPKSYDPDKWALAAKQAGFQYMVITTKHHDGYCLWPSKYGKWNTGKYMQGRDLLRPYVEACRKYGLKVGFYYSPRDWGNKEYRFPFKDYDLNKKWELPELPAEESQEKFEIFFDMVIGQLSELLTRYGTIDLLWFDGIEWPGVDTHSERLHAWLREIQPGMVINPRWDTNDDSKSFGDYKTEEDSWRGHLTEAPVEGGEWWEFCESWSGHWGYSPLDDYRGIDKVIKHLVYARSFGGNLLLNLGPAPDGTMRPGYYKECSKLTKWMKKNRESVIGTQPVMNWQEMGKYPMTKTNKAQYVHLLTDTVKQVEISGVEKPKQVILLESGNVLPFKYFGRERLWIDLKSENSTSLDLVIKLIY